MKQRHHAGGKPWRYVDYFNGKPVILVIHKGGIILSVSGGGPDAA